MQGAKEKNKDENVNRLVLRVIRGELLERERDSFGILYTVYLLSIVKIKRVIRRELRARTKVIQKNVSQGCNKVRNP